MHSPDGGKMVVPLNQLTLGMTSVKVYTVLMEAKWLCLWINTPWEWSLSRYTQPWWSQNGCAFDSTHPGNDHISQGIHNPDGGKLAVPLNQLTLGMISVKVYTALMEAKWLCLWINSPWEWSLSINVYMAIARKCSMGWNKSTYVHLWFETMRLYQIILVNNLIPTWRLIYISLLNRRLDIWHLPLECCSTCIGSRCCRILFTPHLRRYGASVICWDGLCWCTLGFLLHRSCNPKSPVMDSLFHGRRPVLAWHITNWWNWNII
jgi:hypothetical protein